jgi:hypothetical protein
MAAGDDRMTTETVEAPAEKVAPGRFRMDQLDQL